VVSQLNSNSRDIVIKLTASDVVDLQAKEEGIWNSLAVQYLRKLSGLPAYLAGWQGRPE